jgi:hypothetical protein
MIHMGLGPQRRKGAHLPAGAVMVVVGQAHESDLAFESEIIVLAKE